MSFGSVEYAHMFKFIIGLAVLIAIVGAAYYYITIKPLPAAAAQPARPDASAEIDASARVIPAGAVMEDGTLPE